MNQHRLSALALACLSFLSACGGGGGGGGATAPATSSAAAPAPAPGPAAAAPAVPAAPPSAPSLIPEPATAGVVLYNDTGPLRMLVDGSTRTYRGSDDAQGADATAITYSNKVTLSASSASAYAEQNSNLFNGGAAALGSLRVEKGDVLASGLVAFRQGTPALAENLTELRLPVKVNDQFGTIERKNVDIGADLDGDKINETATVAQYSRVFGNEPVDLPNRRALTALRVDTRLRVQITPSATKVAGPVQETLRSTWYAPGLGIVKQRLEQPNPVAGRPNRVVTEVLEQWDGGTVGLGALPSQVPVAPASVAGFAGSRLQFPVAAAGFATHAVVAASVADRPISRGIVLAQIDPRGAIVAARDYTVAELFPGATTYMLELRLIPHGDFLRLTARLDDGTVRMAHLNATGQQIVMAPTNYGTNSSGASDTEGLTFHMMESASFYFTRMYAALYPDGLLYKSADVSRVDGLGGLNAMPNTVIEPVAAEIRNFTAAAALNATGYSWRETTAQTSVRRVAAVRPSFDSFDLIVKRQTLDLPAGACLEADMAALQPGLAITCWVSTSDALAAAHVDTQAQLLLAQGGTLAGEVLKAPWLLPITARPRVLGAAGELHVVANQFGSYWPGEAATPFVTVFRTNAGQSRLALPEPVLLARIRDVPGSVRHVVPVGNRLLVIGATNNDYMSTTPVWLAK